MPTTSAPTDDHPDDQPEHLEHPDRTVAIEHPSDPLAGLERVEAALTASAGSAGGQAGQGRRGRIDVKLLLASFGIAIGLVFVALGVMRSVTGREQQNLPDAIESIDPIRDATQMPQQTRVFIDLVTGYEAVMIIDGIELEVFSLDGEVGQQPPGLGVDDVGGGEQVTIEVPPGAVLEPGNNTLTFTPGPSQPIEAFSTGVHTVTVRYWRTEDGPDRFRTFTWSFYAV